MYSLQWAPLLFARSPQTSLSKGTGQHLHLLSRFPSSFPKQPHAKHYLLWLLIRVGINGPTRATLSVSRVTDCPEITVGRMWTQWYLLSPRNEKAYRSGGSGCIPQSTRHRVAGAASRASASVITEPFLMNKVCCAGMAFPWQMGTKVFANRFTNIAGRVLNSVCWGRVVMLWREVKAWGQWGSRWGTTGW